MQGPELRFGAVGGIGARWRVVPIRLLYLLMNRSRATVSNVRGPVAGKVEAVAVPHHFVRVAGDRAQGLATAGRDGTRVRPLPPG